MQRANHWVVGVLCALGLVACAEKTKQLTPEQLEQVTPWVSKTPTTPEHPLSIKFGDQITLIGYDAPEGKLEPGKSISVTWHFRVDKKLPEGWQLFTHLADASDVSRVNLDANGLLRGIYAPSKWEVGSYVRDKQTLSLAKDWTSPKATVYLGFWKGNERLAVVGPQDGHKRARVVTMEVAVEEPVLLETHAARADKPIKLDGELDEAAWTTAVATPSFVNTLTGAAAEPTVTVKTLWDDTNLYVAFEVADDFLKSTFANNDDHLWEQDAVEVMLDPDGDSTNYFELQVAPSNKSFDTRYDTRRMPKPFGHMDWNAGLTSGVKLRGKLNDDEADQGYTAEIAIPWTAFAAGTTPHAPPKALDTWRINFFVMDERKEGQRSVGWSAPRVGDFHTPKRFGKIVFDAAAVEAKAEEPAKTTGDTAEKAEKPAKAEKKAAEKPAKAETKAPPAPTKSVADKAPTTQPAKP